MTAEIEITKEVQNELIGKGQDMLSQAREMTITSEMQNSQAATFTAALKAEIKRRKALLAPTKTALDASKAAYNGLVMQIVTPLEEITALVTQKIGQFVAIENARRAELQRIEDAKVAELQRKADEKAAEAQRKADEAYAAKCAKAEAANKPPPIAPIPVAAPVIIPQRVITSVGAPAGTTYTTYWSGKCTDIKALCAAVAAGTVDAEYVQVNQVALNAWAKLKKAEGLILAGCVGVKTMGTSQRG